MVFYVQEAKQPFGLSRRQLSKADSSHVNWVAFTKFNWSHPCKDATFFVSISMRELD